MNAPSTRCSIGVKLLGIVAATSIGFVVFSIWLVVSQGKQLQQQHERLRIIQAAATASSYNRMILEEAFYTIEYLMSNGVEYNAQRETQVVKNQNLNATFTDAVSNIERVASTAASSRTCLRTLHDARTRVPSNLRNDTFAIYIQDVFVSCSKILLELEGKLLILLEHSDATKLFLFSRINEEISKENIYGVMYFDSIEHGWSNTSIISQIGSQREHRTANIESLQAVLSDSEWTFFDNNCSGVESRVVQLENMIVSKNQSVTPGHWMASLLAYSSCIEHARNSYETEVASQVYRSLQLDIVSITTVCCLCVVFIFVSSIIEVLFAKSIIESWKALMEELSTVISKFVPHGILQLLQCNSVVQLQLGDARSADLTVLGIEIQNFELLCVNMKLEDVFQFTNSVLCIIGPVVRNHGGFVEKYYNKGLQAVFSGSNDAVQAALHIVLEMQNSSTTINPQFRIGIGCYRASFLIGVVGENQRIESAIISTEIVSQLVKLNAKYGTTILVSESVVSDNQCMYRQLGQFSGYGNEVTTFYEVLAPLSTKVDTMQAFGAAIGMMQKASFKEAAKLFSLVIASDTTDTTAEKLLEQCIVLQERDENFSFSLIELLSKPILKQLFRTHLVLELALENLRAWEAIVGFETEARFKKDHLQEFYDTYLAPTAKYMVNVTDTVVKPVREALANGMVDSKLLLPVKNEVLFTMLDSFERFKRTGAYSAACKVQHIKENITEYAKIK